MQPNVFWLVKDWKEQWEAADLQQLLEQALAVCARPVVYDVPSRDFCDEDTIALAPAGMRCDEATAVLLHDYQAVTVPGTDIDFDADFHWDGEQFRVRLICNGDLMPVVNQAPDPETKKRLLAVHNAWISEEEYIAIQEQAGADDEAWCAQHDADVEQPAVDDNAQVTDRS